MKASTRRTRDGHTIRYLQLAHNEWDPVAKASKTKVLYSLGREDQLDVAEVRHLVDALSRLLDPADALTATTPARLSFVESRPLGGTWLLDGVVEDTGAGVAAVQLAARGRWTPQQLGEFLDGVDDDSLYALWHLAALTGLRRSELIGLRWIDMDLDSWELTVAWQRFEALGQVLDSAPKTEASCQTIAWDDGTCSAGPAAVAAPGLAHPPLNWSPGSSCRRSVARSPPRRRHARLGRRRRHARRPDARPHQPCVHPPTHT